jgi:predicted ATP-grasp superfamily ATP-dependent carboligase
VIIVKILVFEYITGGGFNKQELPDSLVSEGSLMLNALLDNLAGLNGIEITVMLDWRFSELAGENRINKAIIGPEHDINEEFACLVKRSDCVWPIAPEFDSVLQTLCQTVESLGKILLTPPSAAVSIAGNKLETYRLLNRHRIKAVPTSRLEAYVPGEWVIKPVDGVGCADSYIISTQHEFDQVAAQKSNYVVQPHFQGAKTSLSCLFKQGRGWLVSVNLQRFEVIERQYHLTSIVVNHHADKGSYQHLISQVARAMPELWGYAGIDLIENDQTWVLEINPRLTTSFAGIYDALGINIAEAVLQLLQGEPVLNPACNKPITVQAQ